MTIDTKTSVPVITLLLAACSAVSVESTAATYPALPPANEVVLGGSVGAAYQLGLERLRQPPYDSVAYLRADLTHELQRMFTNYSGDVSGRYLEVAALTSTSPDFPSLMEELIETLPAPQPDGHFGAAVDWSQPLEDPNPLTAVTMPIFWGHSRLLVGLIEAYEATGKPRLLELARGIGDFYLLTADRFLDPTRESEYRASGTYAASTVTCYFPGIEGLVRLYRVTGEDQYLEQARRMADFFPDYDRLPLDHCHGSLLTHQALLMLYETTGDRAYLEPVIKRWSEAMMEGYVWVTGGVGEHFSVGAGFDEGCALADWLRLNLDLWRLTTETKYLDAAERLLVNHFVWNRYPNGGYGQLTFQGDDTGPCVLQPGHHGREGTWCCSFHGLLALHELKRFVLAGSPRGIFVNFPFEAAAPIQAMDGSWRVTSTSLPATGEDRRTRITVAGDGHTDKPVSVMLRRPSWSHRVEIVNDQSASVDTTDEGGYIRFELKPGAAVTATFLARPRMEDRRFALLALNSSEVSRHSRIVLADGPEILMANAENPPVLVVAVGPDGQPVLPASASGVRPMITVASLDADEDQITEAIRSATPLKVGPWRTTSRESAIAFVFDAIAVPSDSKLGHSLLARQREIAAPGIRFATDNSSAANGAVEIGWRINVPELPDSLIMEAYEKAADQNVLAALNPEVFFGYWSVCADGLGHGFGNTYPALDGHQMADALLWLGQVDVVKANWDYVKQFQKPNGQLPFAIWPGESGRDKLWFSHHVPGDPLRALATPTYIQNADVIFRFTGDREWLDQQLPSVNLAADHLASLVTPDGAVGGAGYYVERPTRIEFDGVAQCHVADAYRRLADLNAVVGNTVAVKKYRELAGRIETHFQTQFWLQDRFVEYIHPQRGAIANHGLTDVDWSALATGLATVEQRGLLWPQLKREERFYYGGMPTGIATLPDNYEEWEVGDRMDLAAMGRVWYVEAWARTRMGDADGLMDSIRRVCKEGREHGYFWRERYGDAGGFGVEKYCEYPANLIRIVQRFLLGVELGLDGALVLKPTVPDEFWIEGFGQSLAWGNRVIWYRMERGRISGTYSGNGSQRLGVFLGTVGPEVTVKTMIDGRVAASQQIGEVVFVTLPTAVDGQEYPFEISVAAR